MNQDGYDHLRESADDADREEAERAAGRRALERERQRQAIADFESSQVSNGLLAWVGCAALIVIILLAVLVVKLVT